MFIDFKILDQNKELKYDLCIIGSGPAGLGVAKKFINSNYKVAIIESGGIEYEEEYQLLNQGTNSGSSYLSLDSSRVRVFGGASTIWAGYCSAYLEEDFKYRDFISNSGWPINLGHLKKYYKEAADFLNIPYDKFDRDDFFEKTLSGKCFKNFKRDNSFINGKVFQISSEKDRNFGEKLKNEYKLYKNINVIYHATVRNINLNSAYNKVSSIDVTDFSKKNIKIYSKCFVLSAGALENPRILLNSDDILKVGKGNINNYIGKCFMSHPGISNVAEIIKNDDGECIDESEIEENFIVSWRANNSIRKNEKILNHGISFKPKKSLVNLSTYRSGNFFKNFNSLINEFGIKSAIDQTLCRFKGFYSPKYWHVDIGIEQEPTLNNYINLNSSLDSLDMPTLNVHWGNLNQLEKKTVFKVSEIIARELGYNDKGSLKLTDALISGEAFDHQDSINHHIGTTRMSKDKFSGVVDKNCKVFNIDNLYIAGSSVFTTSSIVNPTYTIIAMSLRLGKHLKNTL